MQDPTATVPMAHPPPGGFLARPAAVLTLVAVVTALRIAYLAWGCPYTLIEDEAHYWEWSRRLDWSYYSKGPGVAWSIAASTAVFGDTEFGVRLPAVAFAAVGVLGLASLTRVVFGNGRAPFYAAAGSLLIPAFQFGGFLMTVDMPYIAAWAWAAAAAWRALTQGSRAAWLGLGAAVGAGLLFKYTILLLPVGLVLFGLASRRSLRIASPGWIAGGIALAAVLALPIIIWNGRHGWPTLHHLLGHIGAPGGDMPGDGGRSWRPWAWFAEFVGTQVALVGPMIVVMGLAMVRWWVTTRCDRGLYLVLQAAPILAGYSVLNFITRVEGNWPLAGYVPLAALAGWAVSEATGAPVRASSALASAWRVSVALGVITALAPLRLDWVAASPPMRWLESGLRSAGVLGADRRLIPEGRLWGARAMAADVLGVEQKLEAETGRAAFIIAEHYGRAGLLAFYLPGRPVVYCSSSMDGEGRRTQYDYWSDTDLGDLGRLAGRPAVLLGSKLERWSTAFDRVDDLGRLPKETKRDRRAFAGFGYRGFPQVRGELPPGRSDR